MFEFVRNLHQNVGIRKDMRSFRPARIAKPRVQSISVHQEVPRRIRLSPRFSFRIGDRIGEDLVVIGHLSAGKISELYQVWSDSAICALTCKIVRAGISAGSPEMRGFRQESHLLRRMKHPRIVRLFSEGVHERRPYLIQEYLQGPSLFELIDSAPGRRLPLAEAVKSMIHICAAVDHLHSLGFVHRDIKPANMILHGGAPVLIDFEVAYKLRTGHKPRRAIGTDPYMSPEQCLKQELSFASDVYGLGAVLYEMVTGRWPFEDELVNRTEWRFPQVGVRCPRSPGEFADIPGNLSKTIMRCLSRDPAERFASARELAQQLEQHLAGSDRMWPESLDVISPRRKAV